MSNDAPPPGLGAGRERRCRVGLIGAGAIGHAVAEQLRAGALRAELSGVLALHPVDPDHPSVTDIDELIEVSDVVVESAGAGALREHAQRVVDAGRTLIVVSVGALLAPDLWKLATTAGARVVTTSGAIGGLDVIGASAAADPGIAVHLHTTKKPRSLVQSWMTPAEVARLEGLPPGDGPIEVFSGSSHEAARRFPANLNVAAALALSVRDPDRVRVTLSADAATPQTVHSVEFRSRLGSGLIRIENKPLEANPATSSVVPWAVLRTLEQVVDRAC